MLSDIRISVTKVEFTEFTIGRTLLWQVKQGSVVSDGVTYIPVADLSSSTSPLMRFVLNSVRARVHVLRDSSLTHSKFYGCHNVFIA